MTQKRKAFCFILSYTLCNDPRKKLFSKTKKRSFLLEDAEIMKKHKETDFLHCQYIWKNCAEKLEFVFLFCSVVFL